jgi:hypothetical protein
VVSEWYQKARGYRAFLALLDQGNVATCLWPSQNAPSTHSGE